ncbi:HK97-gp10 family putative phage morphogenesis protein [Ralstonia syzygii subsp. celebesensis]|uniref:HK97 gp10 family phage protein n=2 Tax=Ralstonia syzygii subsp. celebesensis TaxID=1310168 RepID=A0A1U9VED6_9RALS|nr:HK97-gp10 family putative phage morphogenesis protein [Ralstonia syzygii]AQW29038.1 hypothetical protein B0B51_02710 [blood disease bacterium A2-HR MARDI]CCA79299.1 putative phage protein, HK97 gp10 family [blood disease bacterium R229]
MAAKLEIVNPQAMIATIEALTKVASESVLRQAAVAGARVLLDEVRMRAPVNLGIYEGKWGRHPPGFLRRNILLAFDKDTSVEGLRASYLVTWSKEAFYGRFVEFGTSKMAANPFLRPAYEAKKAAAAQKFSEVIEAKAEELTRGQ